MIFTLLILAVIYTASGKTSPTLAHVFAFLCVSYQAPHASAVTATACDCLWAGDKQLHPYVM